MNICAGNCLANIKQITTGSRNNPNELQNKNIDTTYSFTCVETLNMFPLATTESILTVYISKIPIDI